MSNETVDAEKLSIMHVFIEIFFAILPLFFLAVYWPDESGHHPKNIFYGQEISVTSCILYGLSYVRFLQGALNSNNKEDGGHNMPSIIVTLFPFSGVMASIVFISKTSSGGDLWFAAYQTINFCISIVSFIILGGYGLSRTKKGGE